MPLKIKSEPSLKQKDFMFYEEYLAQLTQQNDLEDDDDGTAEEIN